jgi:putative tryptophan/tyrosine transport system substrate-binding protein
MIRRRQFIAGLGSVAAWPLAARAQQAAMPVVGYLSSQGPSEDSQLIAAFHQGLRRLGFVEGQNVAIEYRFGEGQYDRLPALAADLVRRQVAIIAAVGTAALPARAATTMIPIVFSVGVDPVESGLVSRLNRPGGNLTGAHTLNVELGPKRLELLHKLLPTATDIALLINPARANAEPETRDMSAAAGTLGLKLHVLHASTERDIDAAFANVVQQRGGGLVIGGDSFFSARQEQLAALAIRHAVPTIYQYREFAAAGGLMSYGNSHTDGIRLAGVYAGRILKGEKPGDLPVQRVTKIELIINMKTAKALGIDVPPTLLATADEVIE